MFESRWLKQGKKTQVTNTVKAIADSIPGEGLEFLKNASDYIQKIYPTTASNFGSLNIKFPDKRLRSADELLNSTREDLPGKNLISGCIEIATIFRALCIAKRIPTIFVETISEEWKDDKKALFPIQGHIFVDVYVDKHWYTINPANSNWHKSYKNYSLGQRKYIVLAKGLDSDDLGFYTMDIFYAWLAKECNKPALVKK